MSIDNSHPPVFGAPAISVVILTMGTRENELAELISSIRRQHSVETEIVVVENGVHSDVAALSADTVATNRDNTGVTAGRNLGAENTSHDLIAFLDDDGLLRSPNILGDAAARFEANSRLGVIALRICTPEGKTMRRHIPRIGSAGGEESGYVAAFLGGASIIRKAAFEQAGRYDSRFFYSMEETDLSWRLIDAGWQIEYLPDLVLIHPETEPNRHDRAVERTMRNRVWAAWKNLPHPLPIIYVSVWVTITLIREKSITAIMKGLRSAWPTRNNKRSPMSISTVWELARLGRPPII